MEESIKKEEDSFVFDGWNTPPRVKNPIRKPRLSRYSSYSTWKAVPPMNAMVEPEAVSDGWEYEFTGKLVIWYIEEDAENQKVWNKVENSRYKNPKWSKNRLFLDSKSMKRLKSRFTPLVLDIPPGFQADSTKHWEQLYANITHMFLKRGGNDINIGYSSVSDETITNESKGSQEIIFLGFHIDDMSGEKEPVYFDPFLYDAPVQFSIPTPGKHRNLPSPEHILDMLTKIESFATSASVTPI